MDLHEAAHLLRFANPFQSRYATSPERQISPQPQFTAERFQLAMMQLVSSANGEGYDHALTEVFGDDEPPYRASLSKARAGVSWTFYRDQLQRVIDCVDNRRTTFAGLKVYAIDGHQLVLPYTKDLYKSGYSGFPLEDSTSVKRGCSAINACP